MIKFLYRKALLPTGICGIKIAAATSEFFPRRYLAGTVIFLVASSAVFANGAGRFEILNVNYRVEDDMWIADVRAGLELSDEALEALENSVTLTIQYQFNITSNRWYWTDRQIASRIVNIQLSYLSLSQRYLVEYIDAGEKASYATLYSALRQIGRLSDLPIAEASRIDMDDTNVFSLRVVLSREDLPSPLQMLAFWRGDFSLESKWNRWTPK